MKKIIILLIFSSLLYGCYFDDEGGIVRKNWELNISGDCSMISINDDDYYGLQYGVDYVDSGYSDDWPHVLYFNIKKKLNDTSTVSAELFVDEISVYSNNTTEPYGELLIQYDAE